MKKLNDYKKLEKNAFLAELIGIILGDGCITKFERTEALRIVCNSKDKEYALYVSDLVRRVFKKSPACTKRKNENAIDIKLYQKFISKRLGLPAGNKINNNIRTPKWIFTKNAYIRNCLKGLFDTDGHFRKSLQNYLHVIELKNRCRQILSDTFKMLRILGYNPQIGKEYVRLAKKKEVYDFLDLINFRNKHCPVV